MPPHAPARPGFRTVTVEKTTYLVEPVEVLDANLATCRPEHRDALLDVRLDLYPPTRHAPAT